MKKQALIFSDSHGNIYEALKVIERYKGIDAVFHAGDIEGEEDRLRNAIPGQVCIVRGTVMCSGRGCCQRNCVFLLVGKDSLSAMDTDI